MATLIRIFGDIDVAEDAVQDAFAVALRKWPIDGLPPNPGGWITTTARRCAIDRLRRESRGRDLLDEVAVLSSSTEDPGTPEVVAHVQDDRLRLIFTCCNPALSTEAQVALTLRLLGGLTTEEVARAFLVAEPTMAQRLARAKRKIKAARIPYRVPEDRRAARPPASGAGRRLPRLQRRADQPSRAGSLLGGDPAGADPGDAHARRARGGRPVGAVAPHRVAPSLREPRPTARSCCSASRIARDGIGP